jgi:hypothetical protein
MIEEWNKHNPKIGFDESKIALRKVGRYGNYKLRNKLMELITFLKNQYNVVVVPKDHQNYFKQLEKDILEKAINMVNLL